VSQKNILILGGSSDIGAESIRLFLENNWKVTAHYNSKKISPNIYKNYEKVFSQFRFDLKQISKFEKFLKKNKKKFNKFDAFVNLAGYLKPTTFEKFSIKNLYDHLNVNSFSGFLIIRTIFPGMKKRKWGRIVNTSSIGTKFGGAINNFAYSLSKFNNEFFPKYFKNFYSKNVIINSLQIGLTKTKMNKKIKKNFKKRIKVIPLNRMASPEEVANYIFFLCSDKNTLLTGSVINISGGE
jgi:NAD(P)-dependent dehydrogenase (short-subunit alcohol dehydrogenase family)|tara:strand:+ start:1167 stop:1883 length:717 start_codon:yes stop_codon:yes gene_type:complete